MAGAGRGVNPAGTGGPRENGGLGGRFLTNASMDRERWRTVAQVAASRSIERHAPPEFDFAT